MPGNKNKIMEKGLLKKKLKYSSEPLEAGTSENDVQLENVDLSRERVDEKP
jgi:hypothetical protein